MSRGRHETRSIEAVSLQWTVHSSQLTAGKALTVNRQLLTPHAELPHFVIERENRFVEQTDRVAHVGGRRTVRFGDRPDLLHRRNDLLALRCLVRRDLEDL